MKHVINIPLNSNNESQSIKIEGFDRIEITFDPCNENLKDFLKDIDLKVALFNRFHLKNIANMRGNMSIKEMIIFLIGQILSSNNINDIPNISFITINNNIDISNNVYDKPKSTNDEIFTQVTACRMYPDNKSIEYDKYSEYFRGTIKDFIRHYKKKEVTPAVIQIQPINSDNSFNLVNTTMSGLFLKEINKEDLNLPKIYNIENDVYLKDGDGYFNELNRTKVSGSIRSYIQLLT